MNAVWLVLDSLSVSHTPFGPNDPETMPRMKQLAAKSGIIYENAYTPGPLTPSSHAAMVTGQLPSAVGMHEAHPFFESEVPTIADALAETHTTHLISPNMWLFQGLDARFNEGMDFSRQYLLFRESADPVMFDNRYDADSRVDWLLSYIRDSEQPLRSLVNLVNFRLRGGSLVPDSIGDEANFQYASQINKAIRERLNAPGDHFALVNYLDVHPPLNASDASLDALANGYDRSDLPIGVSPERHLTDSEKSYDPELMDILYRASIWDLDRKLAPLVEELIAENTFVIVTSDHGIWDSDTAYSESRLHVPLVLFVPDRSPARDPRTANLRSLPATTMDVLNEGNPFPTASLLSSTGEPQASVTEIIHHPNEVYRQTDRVDVTKSPATEGSVQRDLVLHSDSARIAYVNGSWRDQEGDESELSRLKEEGESILETPLETVELDNLEYDQSTRDRLEALGYT